MNRALLLSGLGLLFLVVACSQAKEKLPQEETCPGDQVLVQGVCVAPGANCTPGKASSITVECATKNRVCHEDALGALCGVCLPGFVAHGDACSKRVGCANLGCEAKGRGCFSNGDADATCGACVPGRVEKGADCVPVTCDPSDPAGPAADCTARLRACVNADTGPTCGDCWANYVDAQGTCRPASGCADASCKIANRLCTPAGLHADAACGDCRTGFSDQAGLCVRRTGTSCDPAGGPDSLLAGCTAEHRGCAVAGDGSADCTGCATGFAEDPDSGACVADMPCGQLSCDAQHRACEQTPFGHCAGCAAGFVEDKASGACRAAITCAELTCGDGQSCVEGGSGEDAACVASCGPGTIRSGDICAHCPSCDGPGEDGVDTTLTQTGYCICKTRPGFFYSVSGDVGTFPCDSDGDGWVRESARNALTSRDPVLAGNARCQVRQIAAFTMVAEDGSTKSNLLQLPLPMFETDRNDDDLLLAAIETATGIPPYGRVIHAAELNRLTKMCHTRRADYNDNGVADVEEWGGQDLAPTMRPEQRPFNDYSYFSELYTGRFEPSLQDPTHGDYVIRERPRDPAGQDPVPVRYADTDGDYGTSCTVLRDAEWDTQSPPIGMDFADKEEAGDGFSGMNHHSQFKCMVIDDQPKPDVPSEIKPADALDYLGRGSPLRLNRCQASGDPRAEAGNPSIPSFTCQVVPDAQVQAGSVFWAAVPFLDYDPYHKHPAVTETTYLRGCINECAAGRLTSCFGWDTNPAAVNCSYDVANFGKFTACQAQELCDGLDNTGEGQIDEGNPGSGVACMNDGSTITPELAAAGHTVAGLTPCASSGDCTGGFICGAARICVVAGVCTPGHTDCQGGRIVCKPDILPGSQIEVCNVDAGNAGIDDNCDGRINESDPRDTSFCNTGNPGICAAGKQACDAPTGVETCVQQQQPLDHEVCGGGDTNCNGKSDDQDTAPTFNGSDCGGNGYTAYYEDADGDGYGNKTKPPICLCKPGGNGTAAEKDFKVLDYTDCCDAGNFASSVHPGQTGWFSAGGCAPQPYDYNCDGVETKAATSLSGGGCTACEDSGDAGWLDVTTVPACGEQADYTNGTCQCGCCGCNTCSSTLYQLCH